MKRDELYDGMRVQVIDFGDKTFEGVLGTLIEIKRTHGFDCLVEFDEDVHGHDGLGWGEVTGLRGHCYWFVAKYLEEVQEAIIPELCSVSYDELFE